jgi:chemosensory pili system protein ChpA (sensor histidine kinase/response regulator)
MASRPGQFSSAGAAKGHAVEASTSGAESGACDGAKPATGFATVPLVLVVDDSITVRRVTQRLLQREGYRVVLAADGLQALERLQDELPGRGVVGHRDAAHGRLRPGAQHPRRRTPSSDLPIIMITSRIAEKHREHARELGVNHYLGKPYSEDELLSLVRHYCGSGLIWPPDPRLSCRSFCSAFLTTA